jgi:hypothetical protein
MGAYLGLRSLSMRVRPVRGLLAPLALLGYPTRPPRSAASFLSRWIALIDRLDASLQKLNAFLGYPWLCQTKEAITRLLVLAALAVPVFVAIPPQ